MAVRNLRRSELHDAAEALTRALYDDPFFRAIEPDSTGRRSVLQRQMCGALRYSLKHGLVETTPELEAVAVWLPPGNTQVTVRTMVRAGPLTTWEMMALPPKAMRRAASFRQPLDRLQQRSAPDPHWFLWILGVDPRYQRQGLGTKLVRHRLGEIGETPVYLETAQRLNLPFYERLGFEVADIAKIPERLVTFWGMISPARERTMSR